ncbi:MAG: DUF411 domain-containing protein [Gemmatimonadaceae bacterium]
MNRRTFIGVSLGAGAMVAIAPSRLFARGTAGKLTVYKSPTCDCCANWVSYMKDQGFDVDGVNLNDLSNIKSSWGVPVKLQSCHTALTGKYVIEGHVPADLVKKMLTEKSLIVGLAVPGMPADAPGMGDGNTPYEVISWTKTGKTKVYATR